MVYTPFVTVAALPPILKLATGVVEVTTKGAVPVATEEVSWPETTRLVPVAAPSTGDTSVGDDANTRAPEPVLSVITSASSDEVVAASVFNLSVVYTPFVTVTALPEMEPEITEEKVLTPTTD